MCPTASWVIDKGKDNGSSPGFRVKVPGKGKYMLKSDGPAGERPSASSVIGGAAYYASGFNFSCEQVIYVKRSAFKLTPGLTTTDNSERVHPFDQAALDKVLDAAGKRGEFLRFQASAWLEGRLIGPSVTRVRVPTTRTTSLPTRTDASCAAAAFSRLGSITSTRASRTAWTPGSPKMRLTPTRHPGYVRHYYLDTSDTLGSEVGLGTESPGRLGYSYVLDWGDIAADFFSLGLIPRRWDHVRREPGQESFGYFSIRDFNPERWLNEYPNPAFSRMTERDGAWMARILAWFTPELVHALVDTGKFSNPSNEGFVERTLGARLQSILARYLTRLSPLARAHIE